jgi:uncharacterized protein (TIGR03000 family)
MMKRWFAAIGGGALALVLLSPSTSSAQVLFGFPFGMYGMGMYGMYGGYGMYGMMGMRGMMMGPVGYNYYMPQNVPSITYNNYVPLYSGLTPSNMTGAFNRTAVANPGLYNSTYASNSGLYYYTAPTMTAVSGGLRSTRTGVSNAAFNAAGGTVDNRATIEVQVPASARVWFEGELTRETGRDRMFRSPPLTPEKNYRYTVRARWTNATGKSVEQTETVQVSAGHTSRVVFPKPVTKEEPKKKPAPPKETKPEKPKGKPGPEGAVKPKAGSEKGSEAKPKKINPGKGSAEKEK